MSDNQTSKLQITGIILAGGAGRRLGGLDKGLHHYQGKPLVEYVIERMQPQVDQMLLCINRNSDQYLQYGHPLIFDQEPDSFQGPLAGVTAAIRYLKHQEQFFNQNHSVLISSCDSPHLPFNHAEKLLSALSESTATSAVVFDGKRTQNLHCVIKQSAWPSIEQFYSDGGRAMYQWHKKNGSIDVNFSDQAACFLNINTTEKFD